MSAFHRFRGKRLLAAVLLAACTPAAHAAEVTLRLSSEPALPKALWVEPLDAAGVAGQPVAIPVVEGEGAVLQARYVGELPAGTWRLAAVTADPFLDHLGGLVPAVAARFEGMRSPGSALVSLVPDGAVFDVPAGAATLDLGAVDLLGRGNAGVIDRIAGDAGWRVPREAFARSSRLAALRADPRFRGAPEPTEDGRWWVLASGGRLAFGDASGWRVQRVVDGGVARLIRRVDGAGVVVAGEAGELEFVSDAGGHETLSAEGLPREQLWSIGCDALLRCVAALGPTSLFRETSEAALYLSTDARTGGWHRVGTLRHKGEVVLLVEGEAMLVRGYGGALVRVPLDGASPASAIDLPLLTLGGLVRLPDGRLSIAGLVSEDRGVTWRRADPSTPHVEWPVDDSGTAHAFGLLVGQPNAHWHAPPGQDFQSPREIPQIGSRGLEQRGVVSHPLLRHVIARRGARQYIHLGGELLVSDDRGVTWGPDALLHEALAPDAAVVGGVERRPLARPEAPVPPGRSTLVLLHQAVGLLRVAYYQRPSLPARYEASEPVEFAWDTTPTMAAVQAKIGDDIVGVSRAGVWDGLMRAGRAPAGLVVERRASEQMIPRLRAAGDVGERVLVRPARMVPGDWPAPVAVSRDYLRLRVALSLKRYEGTRAPFEPRPTTEVVVVVDAPRAISPTAAIDAWAADDAAAMRGAIREAIATAIALDIDGAPAAPEGARTGPIDIVSTSGVDRIEGVVLAVQGPDVLIRLEDGELLRIEGRLLSDVIAEQAAAAGG